MNVVEKIREIVQSFPKIAQMCDTVHVEFGSGKPTSYALASVGDELITEYVTGNQLRQHTFMLFAEYSAINDFERIGNTGVLLELAMWLEGRKGVEVSHEIDGISYPGEITEIRTKNGMLYAVPQDNTVDGVQYQMQIIVKYTLEG